MVTMAPPMRQNSDPSDCGGGPDEGLDRAGLSDPAGRDEAPGELRGGPADWGASGMAGGH
jgi:hypothetical protein